MDDEDVKIESLELWLSKKPYWEQYIWKVNLDNESIDQADIDKAYKYLGEHLGLIDAPAKKRASISFKKEIPTSPEATEAIEKIKIVEIKDFVDVNAISPDCSIKFGPNLTMIYGGNGSGKSGVGRLVANACFSRGDREVLYNVRSDEDYGEPQATFILDDGTDEQIEINYTLGEEYEDLMKFSVFDSASVLIHLDESNQVNFTPAQMKIFDKVADTISILEEKLIAEKTAKRKTNPFDSMFLNGESSSTAIFCKNLNANTKESDFLTHANFDKKSDEGTMKEIQKLIDEKKKLDIPKKKALTASECQNLEALKWSLGQTVAKFTTAKAAEINQLVIDILAKKKLVEGLSIKSFDDGILGTIGTPEWKSLIFAAKELHDAEVATRGGQEVEHCLLCHQKHSPESKALFEKYWKFLESKAEAELAQLVRRQTTTLENLRDTVTTFPKFLATDAGVKILAEEKPKYLENIKTQFITLKGVLTTWGIGLKNLEKIATDQVPAIEFKTIDDLVAAKKLEASKLVDPTTEIAKLTAQLNTLQHKKDATTVKDAALEYLAYLKWSAKAGVVNFGGIKSATTKKRTDSFLASAAKDYKGVFNEELARLECEFNLTMHTNGEQGNTVKEYRLDFAEDYNPSQILSEGEQNACSLADFLTEVQLDRNNCGIIFDDPVTSLDHDRKNLIAKRLVEEAGSRQVIVFTHDLMFMSQMVKHCDKKGVTPVAHWIRKINGIPGYIEENSSPKLTSINSLKKDADDAVKDYDTKGAKEQERMLGGAFDSLRSACEALIEEKLFGKTIQRYEDHVRVGNLEEAIFDQPLALRVVALHGKISEFIPGHNRSELQRESLPTFNDFKAIRKEFNELEADIGTKRSEVIAARGMRRSNSIATQAGW